MRKMKTLFKMGDNHQMINTLNSEEKTSVLLGH